MSFYPPPPSEKSYRRATAALLAALTALLASWVASAQTVSPRVYSAHTPTVLDQIQSAATKKMPLWETWVAASADRVVSVFHNEYVAGSNKVTIGFGMYDRSLGEWRGAGVMPVGDFNATTDPGIAANAITGDFIACAFGGVSPESSGNRGVGTARYNAQMAAWEPWTTRVNVGVGGYVVDKPWIIAGEMSETREEFYLTYWYWPSGSARYAYLRSTDGGDTWVGGDVEVNSQPVTDGRPFAIQPTVAGDGPLYAGYIVKPNQPGGRARFRFLKGTDINDGQDEGKVSFEYLLESENTRLTLLLNHMGSPSNSALMIPGALEARLKPWLLADPTDCNRLFIVYHDTAGGVVSAQIPNDPNDTTLPETTDFNIYARIITRDPNTNYWSLGERVRVNDDQTESESDQFTPSATIDASGRLHVIWYDDRKYTDGPGTPPEDLQPDGTATPSPKFDVFYSRGTVTQGQLLFSENKELFGTGDEADEPGLNYERLHAPTPDWEFPDRPGEYNGIVVDGDLVWTTFTGTSAGIDTGSSTPR